MTCIKYINANFIVYYVIEIKRMWSLIDLWKSIKLIDIGTLLYVYYNSTFKTHKHANASTYEFNEFTRKLYTVVIYLY